MNLNEFFEFVEREQEAETAIIRRKNHDYAGANGDDPFANFRRTEALGICSMEAGMLVRISDKVSRLAEYLRSGKFLVEDESVQDTIRDARNYLALLNGALEERRRARPQAGEPPIAAGMGGRTFQDRSAT